MVFDLAILAASTDATTAAHAVTTNALQPNDTTVSLTCAADKTCPGVYENAWQDLDTTPHTWKAPVEIDPGNLDQPYASWSAVGTSQLSSGPGVYDNAWGDLDTSAHTWAPTTTVDPTSTDVPYSSYAGVGTTQLSGEYDNAWGDLDTTAHTWNPPTTIDPTSADAPYSSYAATGTTQLSYDGTCNPLPGWNPSFNPSSDIGCRLNPMYNEPGLGDGASYGSLGKAVVEHASADGMAAHAVGGSTQLYDTAYPGICDPMPGWKVTWNPPDCSTQVEPDVRGLMPPAAWSQTEQLAAPVAVAPVPEGKAAPAGKPSRPSPGHLLLCGHAALFGAVSATSAVLSEALRGGDKPAAGGAEDLLAKWGQVFRQETASAAAAVTPVGAFVLREHVFAAAPAEAR